MSNKQFKIGPNLEGSLTTETHVGINTSYDVSKAHQHPIGSKDYELGYKVPRGVCNTLWIWYENCTASEVSVLLSADANGDIPLVGAKNIPVTSGATTTTKGSMEAYIGIPFPAPQDTPIVFFHVKTKTGTLDLLKSQITSEV